MTSSVPRLSPRPGRPQQGRDLSACAIRPRLRRDRREVPTVSFDPWNLLCGFVFSTFGFALFRWGKKHGRGPHLLGGIGLMVAPYLCPNLAIMLLVCGLLAGATLLAVRLGW